LGFYRHADWLGSDRLDSTPSRTVRMSEAYAPFGEPYTSSGSTDVAFTGQNQDTLAGLDDFPAREYSYQGRWASPDPAGLAAVDPTNPQSWNRYAYVMNNPLIWTDHSGLCPDDNSWGAQLCKAAQAFAGTPYYNTWDAFSLLFKTVCGTESCGTTINPNAFNLLNTSGGGGSWVSWKLFSAIKDNLVQAACRALNPPDVITAGGGVDAGFIGTAGEQLGLAANGNSGQLSLVNTANLDVGMISLDAYGYVGSIPKVANNSQLGGGFSSVANFTNHVNIAGQRTGISVGLDDHSKTYTLGASALPFTASFGTSRSAVLFTIPYAGYGLNPLRAVCKAAGY